MEFIAYAKNIDQTIKLVCMSKAVNFIHSNNDKNRIFVTATEIMPSKSGSSSQTLNEILNELSELPSLSIPLVKRCQLLDRFEKSYVREVKPVGFSSTAG